MQFRRLALASLIAVAPLVAAAEEHPADYKAGDKVDILFGGVWYPGVVLKVGDKTWYVHYDGYGDNWDTWMPADKLRRRAAGANPPAAAEPAPAEEPAAPAVGGDPVVGEVCEATWNDSWYEVEILKVEGGRFFVHWRGYGKESDEWLPRDRLRRKGEEKEVLPRKGREGDGGGLPPEQMVGREVEVFWHGKWWPATVKKTDGTRLWIRYAGEARGTMEEWAVRERVRSVGAAARVKVDPAAVPGTKGLSGFWWRTYGAGSSTIYQHFLFFPDGRLYFGLPDDPDDFDWTAHQKRDPSGCGAYGLVDEQLHVELGGDADEWKPLTFERVSDTRWKLNGIPTFRPKPFPAGLRLEGRWVNTEAAAVTEMGGAGAVATANAVVYVFRKDGTFDHVNNSTFSAGNTGVFDTAKKQFSGTYEFAGNHLTQRSDGDVQTITAYSMSGDDAPYEMLRIGPHVVRRR